MAISISEQYPGKTAGTNTNYPLGQARNITTPGDGTGTPWEAAIVNDDQGFKQALLAAASLVPSGVPDTAVVSQYLDALKVVAVQAIYTHFSTQTWKNRTGSRNKNQTYTNDTPKNRLVMITVNGGVSSSGNTLLIGGVVVSTFDVHTNMSLVFSFEVRPGESYRLNLSSTVNHWAERD